MLTTQLLVVPFTSPADQNIEEDELMIIRRYVGTYLDYRNTVAETYGSPNLIWIKTSMEKIFGKYLLMAEVASSQLVIIST